MFPSPPTCPAPDRKEMSCSPNEASAHSPPPHVNDFYEKLMMLESPQKVKRKERRKRMERDRAREREGGVRKRRGELARCTKGRGWRCVSCKYRITACQRRRVQPRKRRETQLEDKKKLVCVSKWICFPHTPGSSSSSLNTNRPPWFYSLNSRL